jgi:signal transduction histidine kinase
MVLAEVSHVSERSLGSGVRLQEVLALAMRALRHPQAGIAGVLSAAVSEGGAALAALYLVPPAPGMPELLASAGRDAPSLGAPGPVEEGIVPSLQEVVARTDPSAAGPGHLAAPWRGYPHAGSSATRLPGDQAAVVLLGGPDPIPEGLLATVVGPLGVLASVLSSSRREEALHRHVREMRQEGALLAASLQHDLRTPLTSILGGAETLRERPEQLSEERRDELLEMIAAQSRRLNQMIAEALSRHAGGPDVPLRLALVDVREVCHRVAAAARTARGGEVVIEVEDDQVVTDEGRLERALLNLVDNALKYAPAGQAAHIVGGGSPSSYTLTVADSGPGVSPEVVSALFTPYASDPERTGGVGLGLHSVASLVRELGGHVSYARQSGWTRFSVILPRRRGDRAGSAG